MNLSDTHEQKGHGCSVEEMKVRKKVKKMLATSQPANAAPV